MMEVCFIGVLKSAGIEMSKIAPAMPMPKIKAAKILFIVSPIKIYKYLKHATAPVIPPVPRTAYAPIHAAHILAVIGDGVTQDPAHALAIIRATVPPIPRTAARQDATAPTPINLISELIGSSASNSSSVI